METTGLSSFPPLLQYIVLALAGLGIAFGMVKKYFKEQPTPILTVVPALDDRTAKDLCESIDRLDRTVRDLAHDHGRVIDSHTRLCDATMNLYRATIAVKSVPDNQEFLVLLRELSDRAGVFRPPDPA